MLVLSLGLSIVVFVVFILLYAKDKRHGKENSGYIEVIGVFAFVILGLIIGICWIGTIVATESVLDNKIIMYQEENTLIEQNTDRIVEEYLKHEKDTFSNLKTEESSITLVTLFPELKSDDIIKEQLKIYFENNADIKRLKEEKLDISTKKWILYFGK